MASRPSVATKPKSSARPLAPTRKRSIAKATTPPAAAPSISDGQDILVDAKTASAILSVKAQTLYAYVSRGLIRTKPRHGTKESLYFREDLETIKLKGRRGPGNAMAAERNLSFGGSALTHSSITAISPKGPLYRGRLATDLARQHRGFEACVELLWSGVLPAHGPVWKPMQVPSSLRAFTNALVKVAPQNSSRRLMALTAEAYSVCIGRNAESAHGASVLAARHLIQVLAPVFGLLTDNPHYSPSLVEESLASVVARNSGIEPSSEALQCIDSCLVLCADHELAPSTFAARIAASAGADLFSCINSALGAFEGQLTGMGCDEAETAMHSARSPKAYLDAVQQKRERKETVSGYGHPLYPDGDPRAVLLIEQARLVAGRSAGARLVLDCIDAVSADTGLAPNLAIGLVAMSAALKMPQQTPGALMALGRTAGWVAHTFEQRLAGFLMRPRARYIGPPAI